MEKKKAVKKNIKEDNKVATKKEEKNIEVANEDNVLESQVEKKPCGKAKEVWKIIGLVVFFIAIFALGYFMGKDGLTITIDYASAETKGAVTNPEQGTDKPSVEIIDVPVDPIVEDETTEIIVVDTPVTAKPSQNKVEKKKEPTSYNKAEAIQYFNTAMNKIDKSKPEFDKVLNQKYSFTSSSASDYAMKVLTNIANAATKNGEETKVRKEDGKTERASDACEAKLKESDVKSVKITKEGENYKVSVRLIDGDVNPEGEGLSPYARVFAVNTREQVVERLSNASIKITKENLTVNYREGYIDIVVDKNGNMLSMDYGLKVDLIMKEPKVIGLISLKDLTVVTMVDGKSTNFSW